MTVWTRPRLGCLSMADAVGAKCDCALQKHRHAAMYRAELVSDATGEVYRNTLCIERAKAFASRHGIDFPPGPWPTDRQDAPCRR